MKINIKQIYLIVAISLCFSLLRYVFLEEDYPLLKKSKLESLDVNLNNEEKYSLESMIASINSPTLINTDLAKLLFDNSLATFIDARDVESFVEKHILNSINIPYESIEDINNDNDLSFLFSLKDNFFEEIIIENNKAFYLGIKDNKSFIANSNLGSTNDLKHTTFIIYCSGEGCSLSEDLGFYLNEQLGFDKIFIYEGGIPEWIKSGYPVE